MGRLTHNYMKLIFDITEQNIKDRAEMMELKLSKAQIKEALEIIDNDDTIWEAISEAEIEAISKVSN